MGRKLKFKKLDFGILFGESIDGLQSKLRLSSNEAVEASSQWEESPDLVEKTSDRISPWRLVPIYIVLSLSLIVLLAQAFKLQIIDGANFLNRAEGNHVLIKVDHAPRGVIYDRNGKVLARNKPGFRIAVRKVDLPENWQEKSEEVAKLIGVDNAELINEVQNSKLDSVTIATDLNNEQIIALRTNEDKYPWLDVEIYPKREYPFGEAVATLLGYTGEVSEEDLKQSAGAPYQAGDQVGKEGVEAQFENILRGANGYNLVKVDSQGKKQGFLFQTKPVSGTDITLSVDVELQKQAHQLLVDTLKNKGGTGGSVVIADPKTGEILALASAPSYDNNIFSNALTVSEYQRLINDPGHLLLNRPVASSFPPGSTFKLAVGAAALETGAIDASTKIEDTGFVVLDDITFNNWLWLDHQRTEGEVNMVRAIARSNDTYFYRVGQKLGEAQIAKSAAEFGFGKKAGIELPGETAGLLPTAEWKKKTYGQVWYPGETLNYAIGQGYLLTTPLQINQMTSVFANGGKLIKPTILHNNPPRIEKENFLKPETISVVREGMYQNTVGDGNVSYLFNSFTVKSAGKTGSAESGGENKPHSWYTAYAPFENPEISVTVLVERSGHGSEVSAPIVKNLFSWYFSNIK